jgi:uncharacterized protein
MGLFLLKLIASRPTFPMDMTDRERKIMGDHVAYWTGLRDAGVAVAFGPVLDPKGVWGLAVVEAKDETSVRSLIPSDPAYKGGIGTYEVIPMGLGLCENM